jgi:hypothetical protein
MPTPFSIEDLTAGGKFLGLKTDSPTLATVKKADISSPLAAAIFIKKVGFIRNSKELNNLPIGA